MASKGTTTLKHETFVREPLRNKATGEWKKIEALPGIGPKSAEAFELKGVTNAQHILVRV